uniref:Phospholipid phosphatase related 5b n=1 Tax=Cyprinodon variegatus TaxID=28743 RepID=A0A3Q2G2G4_CYPVA
PLSLISIYLASRYCTVGIHIQYTKKNVVGQSSPKCQGQFFVPVHPWMELPDRFRGSKHLGVKVLKNPSTILFLVQYTSKEFDRSEKTVATGDCCYLNPLVRRTFRFLGVYAFGLFTVDIFVNAGQVVTGNLAPYFLTVCKPNYTALGCQQALRYISHQEACTGNQDDILRARKTFPSKEAALSVYAALYLAMYVTYTVRAKGTRLAKPLLSLGFMCLAFLTGLNRVAEYRNHWADVIAGFIIGMAIATFLVVCVVHNFKGKLLLNEELPEQQSSMAMLNMGQVESPLEKYIASQVGSALLLSRNIQNQHPGNALSFSSCGEAYGDLRMFVC